MSKKIYSTPISMYSATPFYYTKDDKTGEIAKVDPVYNDFLKLATINGKLTSDFYITDNNTGLVDNYNNMVYYPNKRVLDMSTNEMGDWDYTLPSIQVSVKTPVNTPVKTHVNTPVKTHADGHLATYTPLSNATGSFAVQGWRTNDWGNSLKKGLIQLDVISKLGLDKSASAKDVLQFLKDKGYNISVDNYWGNLSKAAYNDYVSRLGGEAPLISNATTTTQATKLPTNLPTKLPTHILTYTPSIYIDPKTGVRTYSPDYDIVTSSDLKKAGITNWDRYNQFMNDTNNVDNRIYKMFTKYLSQSGNTINSSDDFNKYFGTSGRYGNKDRNRILDVIEDALMDYDNKMTNKRYMRGGIINKYLQGGQMDETQQMQQAFLLYLAQKTGALSQEDLENIIQQMGEEGLQQAYQQFMQEMLQQQVQAARFGAKLNYIQKLGGKCPAGTELVYYKSGGKLCKKCLRKQMEEDKENGDAILQFKKSRKKK